MKIYIITGEQSGDLHAANLVSAIKKKNNQVEIRAWGGNHLKSEGVQLVKHIKHTSFMGVWEVMRNIFKIYNNIHLCKKDILSFKPDKLVLVDYPGFNLKIAKFAKEHNIHVTYYIPPKVWAWNQRRVNQIKKYIDETLVIFPFEVDFYKRFGIIANYVGNPLCTYISSKNLNYQETNTIAFLPGSREQEIRNILPKMLSIIPHFKGYRFKLAATTNVSKELYKEISDHIDIEICYDDTYNILSQSRAALVTSGTATLETALLGVPQIVCYKTSWITYLLAKIFVRVRSISLVNILLEKEVVNELIQKELNTENLVQSLTNLLDDSSLILEHYKALKVLLGNQDASSNAAKMILTID